MKGFLYTETGFLNFHPELPKYVVSLDQLTEFRCSNLSPCIEFITLLMDANFF